MTGTNMMRPSVMIFGILNSAFPGRRPDFRKIRPYEGEPVPVYIVYARRVASHCARADSDVTSRHHLERAMVERKNGLTYADSGVDIDAGNRLVDLIKPMVRATARPEPKPKSAVSAACSI